MKLEGTAAIVTGAASGLGRATAQALAEAGAHVVVVDLPSSDGATAAGEIGNGATFVGADVTDPDAVAEAVAAARQLGDLRVAVSCAGIGTPGRVVNRKGALDLAKFTSVINVNLVGTFNVIRLSAEAMAASEPVDGERGVLINTASIAAFDGQVGQAAYAASKGGIVGMTLPIARDLADKLIRCVTIAPGTFNTPLLHSLPAEAIAALGAAVPMPSRLGDPAEFGALAVHVCRNQMLNGETIRLDGALRMAPR